MSMLKNLLLPIFSGVIQKKHFRGCQKCLDIVDTVTGILITVASSYLSVKDGISTVCCRIPGVGCQGFNGPFPSAFLDKC